MPVTSGQFFSYDHWSKAIADAGPRIRIDLSDGGYMEFVVRDTGVEVFSSVPLAIFPAVSNMILVKPVEE